MPMFIFCIILVSYFIAAVDYWKKNPMFGNSEGRKNLIADESGQKTTAGLVCTDREAMISQVTGLHSCDK